MSRALLFTTVKVKLNWLLYREIGESSMATDPFLRSSSLVPNS